jgi:predicted esterase YcpF (UPF0227 family)
MKAQVTGEHLAALGLAGDFICPQLPASPAKAMELALSLVDGVPAEELAIVGSSLGGYYATWLAERLGCRAVLLNPAIVPLKDLDKHVGVTTAWHSDEPFEFRREYIDQLRALAVDKVTRPERYFLIAATGDEVLDYRDMLAHYPGARRTVIEGSDHAISGYRDHVADVVGFCLAKAPR